MNPFVKSGILALLSLLLFACETVSMKAPQDFVVYDKEKSPFRAISADGVRLRVRIEKNEPKGDSGLWQKLMLRYLQESGYRIVETGDLVNNGVQGFYFISLYHFAREDYIYLTSFFPSGEKLYIVEAAGIYKDFMPRKKDLLASIKTLKVEK